MDKRRRYRVVRAEAFFGEFQYLSPVETAPGPEGVKREQHGDEHRYQRVSNQIKPAAEGVSFHER